MPGGKVHWYFVYILASKTRVLYTGVTNNLITRLSQHRSQDNRGFTARYNCHVLVHFEKFRYIDKAIAREKEIKGWVRKRKIDLIEEKNPLWKDLSAASAIDLTS